MNFSVLNQIGEWNPQLFRELKGRLKLRSGLMAGGLSLGLQLLLLFYFYCLLPSKSHPSSAYGDLARIDWVRWWVDIFYSLSFFLPLALLAGGVYLLVSDISQEERRGTLNFIRLSPQSSQSILTGKLLGVPACIYLGILLAVPLHLRAAVGANLSLGQVFCCYLMLAVGCTFLYIGAISYGLAGGGQPWLASVLTLMMTSPIIQSINFFCYRLPETFAEYPGFVSWRWFYLPIGFHFPLIYCFVLASMMGGVYWVWQFLNRRFQNPSATVMSKRQSYFLALCFHLWILGFAVPEFDSSTGYQAFGFFHHIFLGASGMFNIHCSLISLSSHFAGLGAIPAIKSC